MDAEEKMMMAMVRGSLAGLGVARRQGPAQPRRLARRRRRPLLAGGGSAGVCALRSCCCCCRMACRPRPPCPGAPCADRLPRAPCPPRCSRARAVRPRSGSTPSATRCGLCGWRRIWLASRAAARALPAPPLDAAAAWERRLLATARAYNYLTASTCCCTPCRSRCTSEPADSAPLRALKAEAAVHPAGECPSRGPPFFSLPALLLPHCLRLYPPVLSSMYPCCALCTHRPCPPCFRGPCTAAAANRRCCTGVAAAVQALRRCTSASPAPVSCRCCSVSRPKAAGSAP